MNLACSQIFQNFTKHHNHRNDAMDLSCINWFKDAINHCGLKVLNDSASASNHNTLIDWILNAKMLIFPTSHNNDLDMNDYLNLLSTKMRCCCDQRLLIGAITFVAFVIFHIFTFMKIKHLFGGAKEKNLKEIDVSQKIVGKSNTREYKTLIRNNEIIRKSMDLMKYEMKNLKVFDLKYCQPVLHLNVTQKSLNSKALLIIPKLQPNGFSNVHCSSRKVITNKLNDSIFHHRKIRIVLDIEFENDENYVIDNMNATESTLERALEATDNTIEIDNNEINLNQTLYNSCIEDLSDDTDSKFITVESIQTTEEFQSRSRHPLTSSTPRRSYNKNQIPIFRRPSIHHEVLSSINVDRKLTRSKKGSNDFKVGNETTNFNTKIRKSPRIDQNLSNRNK